MIALHGIHHIAIICADYEASKLFYTEILGLTLLQEHYRENRGSWKADLALNGKYVIELFSFPNPPERATRPEAVGLRHLAFTVEDVEAAVAFLNDKKIEAEAIRIDVFTGKKFTFINDPDGLPIEFYEL